MKKPRQEIVWRTTRPGSRSPEGGPLAEQLLAVVDAGIAATICVAPFVFGGRHDMGRLVFVTLVGLSAVAWFARQSLLPSARWTRTAAHGILLAAVALLVLQLVPLPADWLARISPQTVELLPLWTGGGGFQLGTWRTISFTPHETTLALAMLVSYGLLFTVLVQRLQSTSDVERLLNTVAVAAVLMAGFGLLQFFTSNGQFFWCYLHPHRTTDDYAMGSFMNRNHFASFLVLGVGPLLRWLVSVFDAQAAVGKRRHAAIGFAEMIVPGMLLAALTIVLLAIALSLSKGGAMALVTAATVAGAIYWRWQLVDSKYLCGLAGIGLVMLGLLSVYGYEKVADRLDAFASGSLEELDRGEGRRRVWAANLQAIEHGWFTGAGAGSHREICPVYLSDPWPGEYTHAENGYLQVATETGVGGVALLVAGIGLCGVWCLQCLGRLQDRKQQLCFGAAAAGLAASLVHSLVDFVWYIPACTSVAIALAVCTLRLAQVSLPVESRPSATNRIQRPWWLECTALATMLGGWTIYAFFGPAVASIHWDRYLRDAVAGTRLSDDQIAATAPESALSAAALRKPLLDSMLHHLEQTVRWDPAFARAHLRLAARYIQRFEMAQQDAANAMSLQQLRDAAQASASAFQSPAELNAWLNRAVGPNTELLHRAQAHARQAVALSPLQGEGYIFLVELGFLAGDNPLAAEACIAQGRRVRPFDGDVVFEVGKQALLKGDLATAQSEWARCFPNPGAHQLRIVELLAGRMPAGLFLSTFQPDWQTLREIWARYRDAGAQDDLNEIVAYAAHVTEHCERDGRGIPPVYVWLWQSEMYRDLGRNDQTLACLERAYQCNQHVYSVRYRLGYALKNVGRYAEAEPHLRWCSARSPENKQLSAAILEITKLRIAQRDPQHVSAPAATTSGPVRQATFQSTAP